MTNAIILIIWLIPAIAGAWMAYLNRNALKVAESVNKDLKDTLHKYLRPDTITIFWCVEDVQERAPYLDDIQARRVLEFIKKGHDANDGINWGVIDAATEYLYPREVYEIPNLLLLELNTSA